MTLVLICALIGVFAGLLGGALGLGGGVVIVPPLIYLFHAMGFDGAVVAQMAVGTSLATIIVTAGSSVRAHHVAGFVRWPLAWRLAGGIVVGALLGAVLGLGIAKFGLDALSHQLLVFDLGEAMDLQMTPRVIWFALGAAIFTGSIAALIPAWRACRIDAFAVLKDGRVCTAEGTIGQCGEEDGPAAKSRERRELVQAETIRDLRAEVKALTRQGAKAAEELAELKAQMAALTNLPAELAELKAQVAQMAAVLAVAPAQRSASRRSESERES